jgi:hypothetical protein
MCVANYEGEAMASQDMECSSCEKQRKHKEKKARKTTV